MEGWEIISDDLGLVRITCPAHFALRAAALKRFRTT